MRLNLLVLFAACGGPGAEAPLAVPLGLTHDQTARALHDHQYCKTADPHRAAAELQKLETYPRCDRTAAEWGDSWVTALYDGDKLVELRRWERYADDARALERWNALVGERMKTGEPSDPPAKLPPGTKAVRAFRAGSVAVAVYLLTPSPPENANILEKLTY